MTPRLFSLVTLLAAMTTVQAVAAPVFYSTSAPTGNWFVSTTVNPSGDGLLSSFSTANFTQAVSVGRDDYIADNSTGTHGNVGDWTFFVFRQTFDLTGYDAASANLKFQWAADDSGEGFAQRGTWIPKFSLNGGAFINYPGSTSAAPLPTYSYSSVVDLSSGFVSGLNTIDFYIEGNGVTDGFELRTTSFTAAAATTSNVPDSSSTLVLLGLGLLGVADVRRRLKK
jgi:hypothetical protein